MLIKLKYANHLAIIILLCIVNLSGCASLSSSDPKVRLKVVENTSDQDLLLKVVL